jgi:magnesium chelatase family protein
MESGRTTVSRAAAHVTYPARFQLVAAMNPCPCGYAGDASGRCRCTPDAVAKYRTRLSGPLLDRIDLKLEVPRVAHAELRATQPGESSAVVAARVAAARRRQTERSGRPNAWLGNRDIERVCRLEAREHALLDRADERLGLSARANHRVLRVARTIADLAGSVRIGAEHLAESIQYRRFDARA